MTDAPIPEKTVEELELRLAKEASASGYFLNPDKTFTTELVKSLLINERRYGYQACPCRLADGIKARDLDIICPCDYRDPDLAAYDACYCGLYVSEAAAKGQKPIAAIPERRPAPELRGETKAAPQLSGLKYPVWRCKVCGYLCARETPPEICPVCKVKKERFERFI